MKCKILTEGEETCRERKEVNKKERKEVDKNEVKRGKEVDEEKS